MRKYYIFKINKMLNPLYERKSTNIYKLLSKINDLNKSEFKIARDLYSKIIVPIDKEKIDNYLFINHANDIYYKKNNNFHELNSSLEESKLIIYNTFVKIYTTNNISTFFKDICNIDKNMFIVDFDNKDYFYVSDLEAKILAN